MGDRFQRVGINGFPIVGILFFSGRPSNRENDLTGRRDKRRDGARACLDKLPIFDGLHLLRSEQWFREVMMKRRIGFLPALLSIVFLSGCLYDMRYSDLYQQVSSNVLCTNGVYDGQGIEIDVLEEDSYGRQLFQYSMHVVATSQYDRICVVAIRQKATLRDVYFYEDAGFLVAEDFSAIDRRAVAELKLRNDWEQPLQQEKMSKRRIDAPRQFLDDASAIFREAVPMQAGASISGNYVDADGKGKVLYYFYAYQKSEEGGRRTGERSFIAVLNEDGTYDADTWLAELEDIYAYQEQLHALKLANGWKFGVD